MESDISSAIDIGTSLMTILGQVLDLWIIVSILSTLTIVQLVKVVIKHYSDKWFPDADPMNRKILLFSMACVIGYQVSKQFLSGYLPDWENYAYAIAILNPLFYTLALVYAENKKWERVVSILKMKRVTSLDKTEDDKSNVS